MEIYGLPVTGKIQDKIIDIIDNETAHVHLGGCLRLVYLEDTDFSSMDELKSAVAALNVSTIEFK